MKAEITWTGAVSFEARSSSGHTIAVDGPPEAGGQNGGARPMELVLMGVGACSSYDVVEILRKGRERVASCVARLEADRAEDYPRVFTRIRMHFEVSGQGLTEARVARAVALSAEKYCSASIMLQRGGVEITHSYAIVEVAPAEVVGDVEAAAGARIEGEAS